MENFLKHAHTTSRKSRRLRAEAEHARIRAQETRMMIARTLSSYAETLDAVRRAGERNPSRKA